MTQNTVCAGAHNSSAASAISAMSGAALSPSGRCARLNQFYVVRAWHTPPSRPSRAHPSRDPSYRTLFAISLHVAFLDNSELVKC